jgi:hypothetical protein
MYIPDYEIISRVSEAIFQRSVLAIQYKRVNDEAIVHHLVAPFDIGTTNPKRIEQSANNLYAYSYSRIDRKTNQPDPRVVTFNIQSFLEMAPNGDTFDETDLCIKNFQVTNYDYRTCNFALHPDRDWFR